MYQYLASTNVLMYDFIGLIGIVIYFIFNFSQFRRKKLILSGISQRMHSQVSLKSKNKILSSINLYVFIELFIISLVQFAPNGSINMEFGRMVGTGGNYFGTLFFVPPILLIFFYFINVDPLKHFDLLTLAYSLVLIFAKLSCFCQGCCNGIECSFGLYNHDTNLVEFPVQLVETGLALLIFIFLMFWRKRAKEGTLLPTYTILYSATRFFSEFLRSEPDIIWNLKTYHILCIIGVIVGIIELIVVLKFGEKIKELFTTNFIIKIIDKRIEKERIMKKKIVHHKYKKK